MTDTVKYQYLPNNTTKLFQKLNIVLYCCGLADFWIEDVKLPTVFVKFYNVLSNIMEIFMIIFISLEIGAFFTQKNLNEKQAADRIVFGISHPILYCFRLNLMYYKADVRDVLYHLAAELKRIHNDENVEHRMIVKLKLYLTAYVLSCGSCIVMYGISTTIQYIQSGEPFTTVITAWPDVEDTSEVAHAFRVVFYFCWVLYFVRVSGSYVLILSMFISLSSQYKNLQSYFYGLSKTFQQQPDMETDFELAFIFGVKLHTKTLWCNKECQKIYSMIFSAQIVMTVAVLVAVMSQMVKSERDLVTLAAMAATACGILICAGFLMWNAGDVTVEASELPAAIYASGWHKCSGRSSVRVRRLVSTAIMQAQKSVVFLALGFVEISYPTYLAIVKSSYSVFSLLF